MNETESTTQTPADSQARAGGMLILAGLIIGAGAFVVRAFQLESWEAGGDGRDLANRFGGGGSLDESFNNAPYLVAGAVAALVFLAGVILYATANARR